MFLSQNNKCRICGKPKTKHTDHSTCSKILQAQMAEENAARSRAYAARTKPKTNALHTV